MSTNWTFCIREKIGDSSSERDKVDDTLEEEVVTVRSNISRDTGKSGIQEESLIE